MQQVTFKGFVQLIGNSDRLRVYKDGAAVFIGWSYEAKEYLDNLGLTGDEIVQRFKAHLDVAHKDWEKRGLLPPIDTESIPQYIAGDMRINMYYDIYI